MKSRAPSTQHRTQHRSPDAARALRQPRSASDVRVLRAHHALVDLLGAELVEVPRRRVRKPHFVKLVRSSCFGALSGNSRQGNGWRRQSCQSPASHCSQVKSNVGSGAGSISSSCRRDRPQNLAMGLGCVPHDPQMIMAPGSNRKRSQSGRDACRWVKPHWHLCAHSSPIPDLRASILRRWRLDDLGPPYLGGGNVYRYPVSVLEGMDPGERWLPPLGSA
jgi:hypothetical protein